MYVALVELNLRYSSGEKVRYGPYTFPNWEEYQSWVRRFKSALTRLSQNLQQEGGLPYRVIPEFLIGEPMAANEMMDAPEPSEAARNLLILWNSGTVVPVTSP